MSVFPVAVNADRSRDRICRSPAPLQWSPLRWPSVLPPRRPWQYGGHARLCTLLRSLTPPPLTPPPPRISILSPTQVDPHTHLCQISSCSVRPRLLSPCQPAGFTPVMTVVPSACAGQRHQRRKKVRAITLHRRKSLHWPELPPTEPAPAKPAPTADPRRPTPLAPAGPMSILFFTRSSGLPHYPSKPRKNGSYPPASTAHPAPAPLSVRLSLSANQRRKSSAAPVSFDSIFQAPRL